MNLTYKLKTVVTSLSFQLLDIETKKIQLTFAKFLPKSSCCLEEVSHLRK